MPPYLFLFTMGAASLVVQSVLVRECLAMVHGTELVLGFFFSSWFFWIGVGALMGARLAARLSARFELALVLSTVLGSVSTLVAAEMLRHAERWLELPAGVTLSWQATWGVCLMVLAPFGLAVGAAFPLISRLAASGCSASHSLTPPRPPCPPCPPCPPRRSRLQAPSPAPSQANELSPSLPEPRSPIARMYIVEATGAVVGGLLFAFLLVGRFTHYAILGSCAALVSAAAACACTGKARTIGVVTSCIITIALLWLPKWDTASRAAAVAARMPGHDVVTVFDTPYEQIAVGKMADQVTVFANRSPVATLPDPYEMPSLAYSLLAQQPAPTRVLVIGNPITGLARELVSAVQSATARSRITPDMPEGHEGLAAQGLAVQVTIVHPDERLFRELRQILRSEGDASIEPGTAGERIVFEDARAFLRRCTDRFDLVFVDAPEPTSAHVNRLYTEEFYQGVARVLDPSGVLAFRVPGSSVYSGRDVSDTLMSIRRALEKVFPEVVETAGDTLFLFASKTASSLARDPVTIGERLWHYPAATPYTRAIRMGYEPARMRRLEELHRRSRQATSNSDHHPSSYFYGSVVWERVSSRGSPAQSWLTRAMTALQRVRKSHVAGLVALVMVGWTVIARRLCRHTAGAAAYGAAAFVAGFVAMADELALLMEYQSACGGLYQRLAVMSGLFMLGTAGAALATEHYLHRLCPGSRDDERSGCAKRGTLAALAVSAAFGALIDPSVRVAATLEPVEEEVVYALLFLLAGGVLGLTVPAVANGLVESMRGPGQAGPPRVDSYAFRATRAAGLLSAMDHLGAMVGALTVGALVLPALGTRLTLSTVIVSASVAACLVWASSATGRVRVGANSSASS